VSDFDLIIVGTGVAGRTAADEAVRAGLHTALVDRREFGGTCALRGCEPKKVLVAAAEVVGRVRGQADTGVAGKVVLDWPRLVEFKKSLIDPVPGSLEVYYAGEGVALLHGTATFVSASALEVDGRSYAADAVVVATGARPMPLGIPGEELVIDSERFMETEVLPERVAFIGGGYISFEFAAMAAAAGSRVTILHRGHAPLEQFDPELVAKLVAHYGEIGVDVRLDAPVRSVERAAGELLVRFGDGSTHACDLVVHGAGRVPDLAGLDLESAGVAVGRHGIEVDAGMRSVTNPSVFAAGDAAASGLPLTPVGIAQARVAVRNIVSPGSAVFDPPATPSIVFSDPPLASVGLDERAAREQGLDVVVKTTDTSQWLSSKRVGLHHTGVKTLVDGATGRVVGAHILGHNADELVNVFALAIAHGATAEELKGVLWGYPTTTSEIAYML
jgi:glutathione reductase (NADPH)